MSDEATKAPCLETQIADIVRRINKLNRILARLQNLAKKGKA